MSAPRVIVHADDFGIHPSVNEGIERAHIAGIVTSASIMVLGKAFDDAIERTRRLPRLDLGLHFCLVGVEGLPPTLKDFTKAVLLQHLSSASIADALRRQLDMAIRKHRLAISHIDSHQHLHALPPVMQIICAVAPEYGISAIRLPRETRAHARVNLFRSVQAASLNAAARLAAGSISRSNLRTTDRFFGMAVSGSLTATKLFRFLRDADQGFTEIICHPGSDNESLRRAFPWGYDWAGELKALCDPGIRRYLRSGRVELATWRDVCSSLTYVV